jgi:hypothetical protein
MFDGAARDGRDNLVTRDVDDHFSHDVANLD